MIRHVVLLRLNQAATDERVEDIRTRLTALPKPGLIAYAVKADLGLGPDNMDLAIVADFDDVDSFLAYDRDAEHNRIRQELIAPVVDRVERCQFEI
jgi:hypothetical protein